VARSAAVALLAGLVALGTAASAQAGWNRPFRFAGPYSLDLLPAQLAFSPTGQAAVGFAVQDQDHPAVSKAFEVLRSKNGRLVKAHRVPDAQQVLDVAYGGTAPQLLVGASSAHKQCCSSARLVGVTAAGVPRGPRIMVRRLTGTSAGRLIALPGGRLLSVVATAEGVFADQTTRSGQPTPARRLTKASAGPQTLAAIALPGARTMVAWTAATGVPALLPPQGIFVAQGTQNRAPRAAHVAIRVPAGHQIDELALGRAGSGATAAWIESWFDAKGVLRSQVDVADLTGKPRVHTFGLPGLLASGLSLATNTSGAELLAWQGCRPTTTCSVEAAVKDPGRRFGAPVGLGAIDPSQPPAAAVSQAGVGLVGWIDNGHVLAAARARRAHRFVPARVVSATSFAADLTIGFGAAKTAVAAWTQGTFAQSVMGAVFQAP
jgi:hypothetical protein